MIKIQQKENCCGCSACYSICPENAIKMVEDEEGFLYPQLDESLCVNCSLCSDVCLFINFDLRFNDPLVVLAAKQNTKDIRALSQSGGVGFTAAMKTIESGGKVFGAAFCDPEFKVCHREFQDIHALKEFQGSKYVQSDLGDVFKQIFKRLSEGMKVLFTGTPCQVAGLKLFLRRKGCDTHENLFTIGLVCHGVPSPMVFNKYLKYLSNKYRGKVERFNFRDKTFGWHNHIESFVINKRQYHSTVFSTLFSSCTILRPSCFICPFAQKKRVSDITMGDFWGVEKLHPDFDDNLGISLVLINNEHGRTFFDKLSSFFLVKFIRTDVYLQPRLKCPSDKPFNRETFWLDFFSKDFSYVVKKYGRKRILPQIKGKIVQFLKFLGIADFIKFILHKK